MPKVAPRIPPLKFTNPAEVNRKLLGRESLVDVYFSADVETDGPIPGPFSMLSFALVYAGRFDGVKFERPEKFDQALYAELRPISDQYEPEALQVNGLDRDRLCREGKEPQTVMTEAARWVRKIAGEERPVLVAYPLSFDWAWLYWYFVRYSSEGSPFSHSQCFDLKTAFAVKAEIPIALAGRNQLLPQLRSASPHTHHALSDAKEQAEIFAKIFEWKGVHGKHPGGAPRR
jgi:hypothetical protein